MIMVRYILVCAGPVMIILILTTIHFIIAVIIQLIMVLHSSDGMTIKLLPEHRKTALGLSKTAGDQTGAKTDIFIFPITIPRLIQG